jgi:hypothetical protein
MVLPQVYDLLILVDSTYSMGDDLISLQSSLPRIISISILTDCFSRIGLLAYKDYCDNDLLNWSGWLSPSSMSDEPAVDLVRTAKHLYPLGGGDVPEATKTALAKAYELMREDATTVIFLYTDAPPHTSANGSIHDLSSCLGPELSALKVEASYGNFGPYFQDWVSAANLLSGRVGHKKAQVFSFLDLGMSLASTSYYLYLCTMTNGGCFYLENPSPANISKVTVEVLLAWMGVEKAGTSTDVRLPAYLLTYDSVENITELKDEADPAADPFFAASSCTNFKDGDFTITQISSDVLKFNLLKRTSVLDFAKRYATDPQYKVLVIDNLRAIIKSDVVAISLNPVFGSLWRVVCNDRENEARGELIEAFGHEIDRIWNVDEKARIKAWLEESYDFTAQILEAINSVTPEQQFPCICLDPTLAFTAGTADGDDEQTDDKAITLLRRDELLEIGRSCDYKILRRLGRVLTRLTYFNSADDVPAHIAEAPETKTPRIPLSLTSAEHGHRFWKVLLHVVVPGTMLSARPAALLAALSLRLGVQPLLQAAGQEMMLYRGQWNNPDIPENWNLNCLSLLLDADDAYRVRQESHEISPDQYNTGRSLLRARDRLLLERLVSYKMLELNLDTTLTARVGWTPKKNKLPLGPNVNCQSCEYPRSVTLMGESGKCGICLWAEFSGEQRQEATGSNVTYQDTDNTPATWVECSVRTCRAQYVVYQPQKLNVRPKCYYCRSAQEAPVVECFECLNRIIWPINYRPDDMAEYKCHVCTSGHKTTVEVETTAFELSEENTYAWLLRNDGKLSHPFNKRSLFHTISTCGTEDFCSKIELFPRAAQENVTLHGKLVQNLPDVVKELQHWVSGRRTELGTCSLCFSSKRKSDLMLACGRTGCLQRICTDCLGAWYGLNAAGRTINTAALSCPFCRRAPTAKTLAKYGMGIHAVGNLKMAVEEQGTWIYAWCQDCGQAKRYMARVCAVGAPPEWGHWVCDHCKEKADEWVRRLKECPSCGTLTEKTGGCNHIYCTVPGCETHWCFSCKGKFNAQTIYSHMRDTHGGFFEAGDGEEDVDEDEDD